MAIHPYGMTFGYDLSSPYSTYVTVGEVMAVGGPDASAGDTKTTNLATTSAVHTFIAGMIDSGTLTLKIHMTRAEVAALYTSWFFARLTAGYKITYPLQSGDSVSSTWTGLAHINKFTLEEADVDSDETVRMSLTLKLSGVQTFTAGS